VRIFCEQGGGVLQMRTSAFFGAKNFGYFEIYCVSALTMGVERLSQSEHFSEKVWKKVNFSRFCADIFYAGSLRREAADIIFKALVLVNRESTQACSTSFAGECSIFWVSETAWSWHRSHFAPFAVAKKHNSFSLIDIILFLN